ncbi:CRISPR-associated endonuclease Cas2 [uncultured Ruminococcus sp.]|uniref:CRISPR-associated endonuclease Cas2 n=1 Tax=uncultured Ruminococcus sp. TaxID=165186 RepID=UPI0025933ECB|nr:CRISPR-associated endonuclease Cas2 [uncultured Ruminococcus sp.]
MRILVFFDLPTETLEDRRNYRHFRKFLMSSGYIMLQESVYVKLALNKTVVDSSVAAIRNHKPPKGDVQILTVTEKQFARMEYIVGQRQWDIIDTDERFIVL